MSLTRKQLLYQLAEDAAHSFKGHMKTADGYGFTLAGLIAVPIVTSLLLLVWNLPPMLEKLAAAIGFLFSSIALTSTLATNKEKADRTISAHRKLGNKYLCLYNEIKLAATDIDSLDQKKLADYQTRISALNAETSAYPVTFIGREWSSWKISKEMDLKWLRE